MLRLSLGTQTHVLKIADVDICSVTDGFKLEIGADLILKDPRNINKIIANTEIFALLCTNRTLAVQMLASDTNLLPYIKGDIFNPNIYVLNSSLPTFLSDKFGEKNQVGNLVSYRVSLALNTSLGHSVKGRHKPSGKAGWDFTNGSTTIRGRPQIGVSGMDFASWVATPADESAANAGAHRYPTAFLFVGLRTSVAPGGITSVDSLSLLTDAEANSDASLVKNIILSEDPESLTQIYLGPAEVNNQGHWVKAERNPLNRHSRLYENPVLNRKISYKDDLMSRFGENLFHLPDPTIPIGKIPAVTDTEIVNEYISRQENYFSSLYGAKTRVGTLPILFAFNQTQFLRDRGKGFSSFMLNDSVLIGAYTLQSARILRRRKTTKYTFHPLTQNVPAQDFDDEEKVISERATILRLTPNTQTLVFSAEDTYEKESMPGTYAYGVELVYLDNSRDVVKKLLTGKDRGLLRIAEQLSLLREEMQQPWHYNKETGALIAGYAASLQQGKKGEEKIWISAIEAFLSARGAFKTEDQDALQSDAMMIYRNTNPYDHGPDGIYRLWKLINVLISQLQRLFPHDEEYYDHQGPQPKGTRESALVARLPRLVVKHYFNEYFGAENYVPNGYDYFPAINKSVSRYGPFRLVQYSVLSNLLAQQEANFSTDSSTPPVTEPAALRHSFLSPSEFVMNDATYPLAVTPDTSTNEGSVGFKNNSQVASTLALASVLKQTNKNYAQFSMPNSAIEGPSATSTMVLRNNVRLLAAKNCTIKVKQDAKGSLFSQAATSRKNMQPSTEDYEDAAVKMSEPSPFVTNEPSSVGVADFKANARNNDAQEAQVKELASLDTHMLYYLTQTDYFTELGDPQVPVRNITDGKVFKSKGTTLEEFSQKIAAQQTSTNISAQALLRQKLLGQPSGEQIIPSQYIDYANALKGTVGAKDIVNFALKYGLVMGIQYFAGFQRHNSYSMMGAPQWINLTRNQLNNFNVKGSHLLCRLQPPSSEFSAYDGVKASIFDEMFILTSGGSVPQGTYPVAVRGAAALLSSAVSDSLKKLDAMPLQTNTLMFSTLRGAKISSAARYGKNFNPNTHKISRQSLYTNGGDWTTSGGTSDYYVGDYHIHIKANGDAIAMAGPFHTAESHKTLQPATKRASDQLSQAQAYTALTGSFGAPPSTYAGQGAGSAPLPGSPFLQSAGMFSALTASSALPGAGGGTGPFGGGGGGSY